MTNPKVYKKKLPNSKVCHIAIAVVWLDLQEAFKIELNDWIERSILD